MTSQEASSSQPPAGGTGKRVLACDDEQAVTRIVARFLRFGGFEVDTLSDPCEVMGQLAAASYDLLLLDLVMPGRSGLEVLAELRERPELAELPVIVLTAKVLNPSERAALRRARATVMQKPFLLHELLQRVHQAVSA